MVFCKHGEVTITEGPEETIPEALCVIVCIMESLYVGGNERLIEKVLKPELKKMSEINSIKDLRKYERMNR